MGLRLAMVYTAQQYLLLYIYCIQMLFWFCNEEVVDSAVGGGRPIEESEVEAQSAPNEVVDNDITPLEHYFTPDGWVIVQQAGKYTVICPNLQHIGLLVR